MGGLSEIDSQAPCYPASAQVVPIRERYRDGVNGGACHATMLRQGGMPAGRSLVNQSIVTTSHALLKATPEASETVQMMP
jgi:hypothetical protein